MAVDMRILKKLKEREREIDSQLREIESHRNSGAVTISTHRSGAARFPHFGKVPTISQLGNRKTIQDPKKSKSKDFN